MASYKRENGNGKMSEELGQNITTDQKYISEDDFTQEILKLKHELDKYSETIITNVLIIVVYHINNARTSK